MKNMQLLWVYHTHLSPDSGVKSHSHEYYHLICMYSGQISFTAGSSSFQVCDGDLIVVPSGTQHSFHNHSDSVAVYYEIKFSVMSSTLDQLLRSSVLYRHGDSFAYALAEHIAKEYLHCRTWGDESASSALSTLLYHITADSRMIRQGVPDVIDTADYNPLCKKVIAFLSEHYSEPLSLDDVSAGVSISKNYLCNAFKRGTGITILECLNIIRIRKAAELIVYSDMTIAQVARMCGYISTSHFNRVFSHYAGIPPGQCRRAFSFSICTADKPSGLHPESFMYSVLAGKSISPSVINAFERSTAI